jgi:D-3-phosphoglycerate dehydrogenase
LATWLPVVLFVDRGLPPEPFASAFDGRLRCCADVDVDVDLGIDDDVNADMRERVVAVVTGATPVGVEDVVAYPNLRLVLTCSIGTDHLDVAGLSARGLAVRNTPTYCTEEVADHALACVLAGWRGLWRLDRAVRAGAWEPATMLRRFDAQRLGIVGLGRIGRALARRAGALGIEVVGHDPYVSAPDGVTHLPLAELLATSDAVSLHLPATAGFSPLLGAGELALMKPDAVLVNLARAALVDIDAMVGALRAGRLGGAAWDVWPQEPPASGDARLDAPGLIVTPHVGWSSPQADVAYVAEAIEVLRSVLLEGKG